MVGLFFLKLKDRGIQYQCILPQLDAEHDKSPAIELPPLTYPAQVQPIGNLLGGEHLRIDERVHAKILEKLLALGLQVLVVVDACHGLLGSERMGQYARSDVGALLGSNSHKEVGITDTRILQAID